MNYRKEDLISSENFFREVVIEGYDLSTLINLYEKMFLIREVEKVLASGKKNGIIGFHWLSVRNQSFRQRTQLTDEKLSTLFLGLERYPTTW